MKEKAGVQWQKRIFKIEISFKILFKSTPSCANSYKRNKVNFHNNAIFHKCNKFFIQSRKDTIRINRVDAKTTYAGVP